MRVIFYHGLEGSPNGDKPTALRKIFPTLESPDFQGVDPTERVRLASEDLEAHGEPAYLIGSSLGGMMAAIMANRHPNLVKGYLLCVPAMHWSGHTKGITKVPAVAQMLLAKNDSTALNDAALAFATQHGIPTRTVDDGHRLVGHVDLIVALAEIDYLAAMQA